MNTARETIYMDRRNFHRGLALAALTPAFAVHRRSLTEYALPPAALAQLVTEPKSLWHQPTTPAPQEPS